MTDTLAQLLDRRADTYTESIINDTFPKGVLPMAPKATPKKPAVRPGTGRTETKATAGRATPRRVIAIADNIWHPAQDLAEARGISANELVRQLLLLTVHEARQSGELPKDGRK